MSFWKKLVGKSQEHDEVRNPNKVNYSEANYNSGFFVFDWNSMDGYYGKQAFDAIYAALSDSKGTCAFNDGDVFDVDTVERLLRNAKKVVASNEKSPLADSSNKNLKEYGFYFASMWTDNNSNFAKVNKYLVVQNLAGYLGYFLVGDYDYKDFLQLASSLTLPIGLGVRDGSVLKGMTKYGIGINKKADVELLRAAQSGNLDAVKNAISEGAVIDCVDEEDNASTPLFHAAIEGYSEIVSYLIQKGANPNANNVINTALMLAARRGHIEVVKELIVGGVNINESDGHGSTAFDNASDYPEIQKLLKNPNLVFSEKENDSPKVKTESNVDSDYPTVKIGTQVWMTENLNVDRFRNGDPITEVRSALEWKKAGEEGKPAWCYYENDPANGEIYGKLYNWYAVNDPRGLAPKGWHVPSDEEWKVLTEYLGGYNLAGGKMKSTGTQYWKSPNEEAINSSGFSGFPGGFRNANGGFYGFGRLGYWWRSIELDPNSPGTAFWSMASAMSAGATTMRRVGALFVASGIRQFKYLGCSN